MNKKITLEHVGYQIRGTVYVSMWGGGEGEIEMNPVTIPNGKLTKDTLLSSLNDARFGVEGFLGAEVDVYDVYGEGNCHFEFNRPISIAARPYRQRLFCRGI